jgi:hypothetical protein
MFRALRVCMSVRTRLSCCGVSGAGKRSTAWPTRSIVSVSQTVTIGPIEIRTYSVTAKSLLPGPPMAAAATCRV